MTLAPWLGRRSYAILVGDATTKLRELPAESFRCCVTSPPYWGLRDYGHAGQLGLESTPAEYVEKLVAVFREVRRVLADDGTLWLNLGDSYSAPNGRSGGGTYGRGPNSQLSHMHEAQERGIVRDFGLAAKQLIGIPWRVAFALQADGWYLRSDIIWSKPNPMPESVRDRPTKAHEYMFLLSKRERYFFDQEAVRVPAVREDNRKPYGSDGAWQMDGRNKWDTGAGQPQERDATTANVRSVWNIATQPYAESHFATFPEALVRPCIKAGSAVGDAVLDPFAGSGTVGAVSCPLGRSFIGTELNPEYAQMAERRIRKALRPQTARDERAHNSPLFNPT